MSEFEKRWETGAEAARNALPKQDDTIPFGFATRVVAQWQAERKSATPRLLLWDILSRRALAGLAIALVITAVLIWPTEGQSGLTQPALEDAVPESIFSL